MNGRRILCSEPVSEFETTIPATGHEAAETADFSDVILTFLMIYTTPLLEGYLPIFERVPTESSRKLFACGGSLTWPLCPFI